MASAKQQSMGDRRGLLTDREREILTGEADVSDSYRYQTVSRIRKRMRRLQQDMEALGEHADLLDEFHDIIDESTTKSLLEAAARDRWGEEWTLLTQSYADGDSQLYAYHIAPHEEPGMVVKERLFPGADGEVYHDRVLVKQEKIVDVLERDEPPTEIAGEMVRE